MSLAAVLWALDRAPTASPSESLVLVALADRADENGRRCFLSVATLARRTQQSDATVKRRLRELRSRGLIRVAPDQGAVAHLPEGRRPVVHELVMTLDRRTGDEPFGGPDSDDDLDWHYGEEAYPGPADEPLPAGLSETAGQVGGQIDPPPDLGEHGDAHGPHGGRIKAGGNADPVGGQFDPPPHLHEHGRPHELVDNGEEGSRLSPVGGRPGTPWGVTAATPGGSLLTHKTLTSPLVSGSGGGSRVATRAGARGAAGGPARPGDPPRSRVELPGRCERHLFDPAPPPCGGCKDARLAWELGRADEKAREASAALDAVAARSRALAKQEARAVAASRLAFEAEQERLIEATLGVPHEQARCTDCWGEPAAAGAGCRHFEDHRTLIHLTLNAREIPADPADLCPVCGGTRKIVTEDGEELFCTHSRGSIARWAPDGPAPAADGAAA